MHVLTWTPLVMTVFWWRMVLVPIMLLFSPSLPAGLTPNLGLRQPGLVFGCLRLWWGDRGPVMGQPGEPFIFLRGRYL